MVLAAAVVIHLKLSFAAEDNGVDMWSKLSFLAVLLPPVEGVMETGYSDTEVHFGCRGMLFGNDTTVPFTSGLQEAGEARASPAVLATAPDGGRYSFDSRICLYITFLI